MSDQENGVQELAAPTMVAPPEMSLIGTKIMTSIRQWYASEAPIYKLDPMLLNHVICTALVQYAAVLSVDMGVAKENFLKSAGLLHDDAYDKAPKFGE